MRSRVDGRLIAIKLVLFSAIYPLCAMAVFAAHFVISYDKAEYADFFPLFQNRLELVYFRFFRLAFLCGLVASILCSVFGIVRLWEVAVLVLLALSLLLDWFAVNGFAKLPDYVPFVTSQTMLGGALALVVDIALIRSARLFLVRLA